MLTDGHAHHVSSQLPAAREVKDPLAMSAQDDKWLLQVLLLDIDRAAVSLAQCAGMQEPLGGTWPCWHLPAGLADVDIDKITEPMPSSAYRCGARTLFFAGTLIICDPTLLIVA